MRALPPWTNRAIFPERGGISLAAEGDNLSRSDQLPNSTEHIGIDSSGAETPTASLKGLSMLDKVGFDDADYSVVVKHRGRPPNPWRWEILSRR